MGYAERMKARHDADAKRGGPIDILAIESSCDETAAAVVRDGRVLLSSVVASQMASHQRFGGVVPEVASRAHTEQVTRVVAQALTEADKELGDLQAIAVTHAPGLIGALFVGVTAAKSLALATGLPLIGVHHLAGHIAASALSSDIEPPYLALVVSGGHTELLSVRGHGDFVRLGRTRDDAAGEALDKIARALGLGYPGGPLIEQAAREGDAHAISLPVAKVSTGQWDFSFSGLKSAALLHMDKERRALREVNVADMAASFQEAVVEALVLHTDSALAHTGLRQLVVAGGVAANGRLRDRLTELCALRGVRLIVPDLWLCTDNAAMIGAAAYPRYCKGQFDDLTLTAQATLSLEQWL
ncbi:MAG: tRNA (adenosine(37)-N6)-threonylcarbamoyltransferase complex transferase subunit TsaD [Firmicutes bacterium]|nr:tRNA (adenosine(37)-N6)-threonylcarbamoyltransferase complex transferase subunit TsaD [Bacillota bacterium]